MRSRSEKTVVSRVISRATGSWHDWSLVGRLGPSPARGRATASRCTGFGFAGGAADLGAQDVSPLDVQTLGRKGRHEVATCLIEGNVDPAKR